MELSETRVERLLLATLIPHAGAPNAGEDYPVHAFAIVHPDGVILVDTGLGQGNDLIERLYPGPRHDVVDTLADRGISADDVIAVVNTHLHFDHCGGNARFAGRPIHVQTREIEAARTPHYTVPDWAFFEGAKWWPQAGDFDLAAGVRLLSTPGHTPGHQSVLVDTGERRILIAGQAALDAREFSRAPAEREAHPGLFADYEASFRRLRELDADEVHFTHDAEVHFAR